MAEESNVKTVRAPDDQAFLPILRVDRDGGYCLECGRPWQAMPRSGGQRAIPTTWWPWLLVALGAYLVVLLSSRGWGAGYLVGISAEPRPPLSCLIAGTEQDYATCDLTNARAMAAFGAGWTLVGLGAIARRTRLPGRRRDQVWSRRTVTSPGRDSLGKLALGIWVRAEDLGHLSLSVLLLVGYVGVIRFLQGVPLSEMFVAQTIDRSLGDVLTVLQSL